MKKAEAEDKYSKIKIFVASPGDVQVEREKLSKVVNELNLTISAIAPEKKIILELIRWETNVAPGVDVDAQKVVTRQTPDYNIFIGILWKRIGTPTTSSISGTAEEFEIAFTKWKENGDMQILMYFCQELFPPPVTIEEVKQLEEVVRFRTNLAKSGFLMADYASHESFDDIIRPHLLMVIGQMLLKHNNSISANKIQELPDQQATPATGQKIISLAHQYDEIRKTMPSGDDRTRKMSVIATQMRSLSQAAYALLPELVLGESAGLRLAAISILQSLPDAAYLDWMANQIRVEMPFVRYQIAQAFLAAVRLLDRSTNYQRLKAAIEKAIQNIELSEWDHSDQLAILKQAHEEIESPIFHIKH